MSSTAPAAPVQKPAPLALVKSELPQWVSDSIKPYAQDGGFELVLPALPVNSQLGKGLAASVSIVRIDPDPQGGEVFKVGSRKKGDGWEDVYSYAKPALEKLASAAGIQLRTRRVDDRKDRDLCEFEAVGAMRNESGEVTMRTGTASIRFSEYSEDRWTEILTANEKSKYPKKEDELRSSWRSEMAQYRKHFASRVETKAALRVIRSLLAVKSQLTAEQVKRPKVLLRISLDTQDPEVRRALLAEGASASSLLYGPARERSGAEVVEAAPIAGALPAGDFDDPAGEPLGPASAEPSPSTTSDADLFTEGCGALGLDIAEAAKVLSEAGGDYAKANTLLNARANSK